MGHLQRGSAGIEHHGRPFRHQFRRCPADQNFLPIHPLDAFQIRQLGHKAFGGLNAARNNQNLARDSQHSNVAPHGHLRHTKMVGEFRVSGGGALFQDLAQFRDSGSAFRV